MFIELIFYLFALAVTITIHEVAHAWVADRLGDPTARLEGRLSLNPIVHYDPVGTTLLLVTGLLSVVGNLGFAFGWAKPVRFDPYNLKNPRRDTALISLAGPLSNIIFAVFLSVVFRLIVSPFSPLNIIYSVVTNLIILNVSLAIFNLIPIHPLDGGKILSGVLPHKQAIAFDLFLNRYGFMILFLLIFPILGGRSLISSFIGPIIRFFILLLIPGSLQI